MKFTRLNSYSCYIKFEGTEVWVDSRNLHDPYYHNLNDFRHQSYLMEKAEKKRSASQSEEERKKRITAAMVMSEQQMFQEEHLKLQQEVSLLRSQMNKMIRVLNALQQRFQEHISNDSAGATPAASITSSRGAGSCPDDLACLDWSDWDCNCPDNLDCAMHPDKKKKKQ